MTPGIIYTLLLTAGVFYLFASEKISVEATCLLALSALMIAAYSTRDFYGWNLPAPESMLLGFANPALATIVALLIMGEGLNQSGAFEELGKMVIQKLGGNATLAIFTTLFVVILTSSLVNNTPAVIIFIPIIAALATRFKIPPSKLLMKLSYTSIFGGMLTLIGSSTNLLVVGSLVALGAPAPGLFGFTLAGLVMVASGMIFVFFFMDKLLPKRASHLEDSVNAGQPFLAQLSIVKGSELVGAKSVAGGFSELAGLTVRAIYRRGRVFLPPFEQITIRAGDELMVAASKKEIEVLARSRRMEIIPVDLETKPKSGEEPNEEDENLHLVEMIVLPRSQLLGRSLSQTNFFDNYRCHVIGVPHRSRQHRGVLADIPLEAGDTLLVVATENRIENMRHHPDVLPVEWSSRQIRDPASLRKAVAISLVTLVFMVSGVLPTFVAVIAGALAMILTRVLRLEQAFHAIDREIVLLIAVSLALGYAFESTGTAKFLAGQLSEPASYLPSYLLLGMFFLVVACAANLLTAKPAALLFTPIAVELSATFNMPVEPFAIAIIFGANCAFASPMGYQTNLLVMGPGNYRFFDYVRAGVPLILWSSITFTLMARFFPFPSW